MAGHQPVQRHVQPGHPGAGQHHQRQPAGLAAGRTRRLRQDRSHGEPHAAAVRPLLGLCVALRPICRHAAACARTVRVRRPLFRPRFRSVAAARRLLLRGDRRIALRPAGQAAALRAIRCSSTASRISAISTRAMPRRGHRRIQKAASVGGGVRLDWFDHVDADLSVAKAIEGPRNDTRFFFILSAHN